MRRREGPAGAVDVERQLAVGGDVGEVEQLRHDDVRHAVVDLRAHEDDPLLEQPAVDVEAPLTGRGPLDDVRDRVAAHRQAQSIPDGRRRPDVVERRHDVVDDPVGLRLVGTEPPVPLTVGGDLLDRLAGVLRLELVDAGASSS